MKGGGSIAPFFVISRLMEAPFAWILKTEPKSFSWSDLLEAGVTIWDGVRNYQARNYMALMAPGQPALIYHSGKEPCIVGMARVNSGPFADPGDATGKFLAIEIVPDHTLTKPIGLSLLRQRPGLVGIPLFSQGRLSVVPLTDAQYQDILSINTETHG